MCDVWIISHDGGVYIVEMDKEIYLSGLYDYYGELLTDKQKNYFESYYFNNLSLAEIANERGISRNAVFDQLKKTYTLLEEYEKKLSLYKKYELRQAIYEKLLEIDDEKVNELTEKLKKIE